MDEIFQIGRDSAVINGVVGQLIILGDDLRVGDIRAVWHQAIIAIIALSTVAGANLSWDKDLLSFAGFVASRIAATEPPFPLPP